MKIKRKTKRDKKINANSFLSQWFLRDSKIILSNVVKKISWSKLHILHGWNVMNYTMTQFFYHLLQNPQLVCQSTQSEGFRGLTAWPSWIPHFQIFRYRQIPSISQWWQHPNVLRRFQARLATTSSSKWGFASASREIHRQQAHKEDWNCDACKAAKKPTTIPGIEGETIKTHKAQNQLKIVQWNCNGLHGKASELEHFMLKNKIDIACLQETKLTPSGKPITFAGFTAVSKPRTREGVSRGGGVMPLIREGIHFQDAPYAHPDRHSGMEGVSIKVTTAENPLAISNLYYPPASSSSVSSYSSANALSIIPNENELVVGDLNAHHELWDSRPTDDRGNSLADSILVNSAAVLNNGDATRRSPATGTETSPDVTICHRSLVARWQGNLGGNRRAELRPPPNHHHRLQHGWM